MTKTINIAIDGPSGSGKSTLAKGLAAALGYIYIDTGALYRAIGLFAARHGVSSESPEDVVPLLPLMDLQMRLENGGNAVDLDGVRLGEEIRTSSASHYASQVSKVPEVRAFLLETQRNIARTNNVIMDGRDIGTVVLPDADVKIFLTASAEVRAQRRLKELKEKGIETSFEEVLSEMKYRDKQDSEREVAPLKKADDAVLADTSDKTFDESVELILDIIRENK